ncbi:methyl-accepting chemotaxis protein [Loktanella sp. D2R18]|uniref:methyl-accepting chemotaxis protein n=1 Tax=Rhodobacterales TaxID=204455 RepID=UPI000DE87863|nr:MULTISPECIES: methyl-accepting chemotaxis protein [Rhodobacterales]MDO6589595.1 methyl-accepting chemotaxis protein [Yoonia sp. 1_MG-2023]RBW44230.1 methyl-accepting chemotaxis protein [Loktanella sp. D2R18]
MNFLNAIRISTKLPMLVATLCLLASASVALLGYYDLQRNILKNQRGTFELLAEERIAALETWLGKVTDDVANLGNDPTVVSAVSAFGASHNLMIDSAGLQAAYITDNPNPIGEKELLDQATESLPYHFQHGSFHPFFRQTKNVDGYYDIFLFNLDGDMLYSVVKEADFATNFETGPYRDSGLADVFRAARDGATGDVHFADFTSYSPSGGAAALFLATPVVDTQGAAIGVVAAQLPPHRIDNIINNPIGLGATGELYAVGQDGHARSDSRFAGGFSALSTLANITHLLGDTGSYHINVPGVTGNQVVAVVSKLDVFDGHWDIIAEMDMDEVLAPVVVARNKMLIVSAVIAAMAAILGWLTARSVVVPLNRLEQSMHAVADHKYDDPVDDQYREDEIGQLSKSLVALRDKLCVAEAADQAQKEIQQEQTLVVNRLSTALTNLADGDLTQKLSTPFSETYDKLRLDYNRTLETLHATISSVVHGTRGIQTRSDEMSKSSDELSRRTENQAATLEETAAALDELTASVSAAASGAKEVESIVAHAQSDADASETVVHNAVTAMTEISGSSTEISQIIGVIADIAFQTNLLALNAGVEAARAGEAGRGFAVVASEVRALAQRSSEAARQIKELISGSSEQVDRGVTLVGQAGDVLTRIANHIGHISSLMSDIAAGAAEQSTGLGEINIGVTQLDQVTQQNAAMVEEATAGSHALTTQATQLSTLVEKFKIGTENAVSKYPEPAATTNVTTFASRRKPTLTPAPAPAPAPKRVVNAVNTPDPDVGWEDF